MSKRLKFGFVLAVLAFILPLFSQRTAEAQSLEAVVDNLLLKLGYADGSTNMRVAVRNSTGVPITVTINTEQGPRGTFVLQPGESFDGATYWFSQQHAVWLTYGPVDGSVVYIGPAVVVENSSVMRVYFTPNPATITFDVKALGNGAVGLNTYTQLQGAIDWQQANTAPVAEIVQVDPPPAGTGRCSCVFSCNWWDLNPTRYDFLVAREDCSGPDPNIQSVVRANCPNPSTGVSCRYKP